MKNLSVLQIVKNYLGVGGFEGLYNEDLRCCCILYDLAPCGSMGERCQAGYNQGPRNGRDWWIGPELTLRCPSCGAVCSRDAAGCPACGASLD